MQILGLPNCAELKSKSYLCPMLVVVTGVSGTGKTTLGLGLSQALEIPFLDADDLLVEDALEYNLNYLINFLQN